MGTGVQSEESQWPHHFNMMGQLFVGFIFLIVAGMSYMVSHPRPGSVLSSRPDERLPFLASVVPTLPRFIAVLVFEGPQDGKIAHARR